MEIKGDNYSITYDKLKCEIICKGSFRLAGVSLYQKIVDMLNEIVEMQPPEITLNFTELQFLNSSGINVIFKFVIKVRNKKTIHLTILGTSKFTWQKKSLKNLKRLMPSINLNIE